ncbi:MmpS family transport accessory protein [Gordonia shandongensis]|uniref:MmpS family transport accessory protein n=1 Tax=Gordonia shandongensis TaxID=376351 RepID=UPI00040CFCC3|nr:MmpS family transport accessory protein [Gordonia shandongensis]
MSRLCENTNQQVGTENCVAGSAPPRSAPATAGSARRPRPPLPPQQPDQPYQPQQPYQPPKKRKKWPWIVGIIVVVFIAIIGGCAAFVGGVANEIDKESKSTVDVTYRVTGDGTAGSIVYSDANFNSAQDTEASLPWEKKVTLTGFGKVASLTASNSFDGNGKITCEILVDGTVKNSQTANGPGASASCSYSASSSD